MAPPDDVRRRFPDAPSAEQYWLDAPGADVEVVLPRRPEAAAEVPVATVVAADPRNRFYAADVEAEAEAISSGLSGGAIVGGIAITAALIGLLLAF